MTFLKYTFSFLTFSLLLIACGEQQKDPVLTELNGYAQGSTYHIKYLSSGEEDLSDAVNAIFKRIDLSMSTYIPTSLISQVNKGDTLVEVDSMFIQVLERSMEIAGETNGDFDPTVGPLVRLWGFDFEEIRKDVRPDTIQQVKDLTGFQHITQQGNKVSVPEGFRLDFNAIAQGFTVDYLAGYLESRDIHNYMIEVGGEIRAKGVNEKNSVWKIGIDKPTEEIDRQDRFQYIMKLKDAGLATSGNYRKFWVDEETGTRYSHTIDPHTGYPAKNRLLSASIMAPSAMDADAFATACMVMGLEECKLLLKQKENLEGYLVFDIGESKWGTFITEGMNHYIVKDSL